MKKTVLILFCLIPSFLISQESVFTGTVAGTDGKPMPLANVQLFRMTDRKPLGLVEASPEGAFRIATAEQGMLRLQFSGVGHMAANVPLLVEQTGTVELNVRLAAYPYKEKIDDPQIIGDFNNFNFNIPEKMTGQADGTFAAEFKTEKNEFRYQIVNVLDDTRSINGTQSDTFEYDGEGDYYSVLNVTGGNVRVVFDPRKIRRSAAEEEITFGMKSQDAQRYYSAYQYVMKNQENYQKAALAYQKSGKDMAGFRFDVSGPLTSLAKKIKAEQDPGVRRLLLMEYLGISPMAREEADLAIIRQALDEIPPESGIWSASPGLVLSAAARIDGKDFDAKTYMDGFLAKNKDHGLKAAILFNEMMTAKYLRQEERYKEYYTMLVEEYGDTQFGMMAKQRFSAETAIAVGKKVPSFALASLGDNGRPISNALFEGKTTLLDFWAVWCGPCIGEMDNMHKAYEKFKGKNFQIISFSFDAKPEDVVQFRTKKWKMPWLHAFVEKGFESELAKKFEVIGIPKPILVNEEGTILAVDSDLRGENLEKTLERVLGK